MRCDDGASADPRPGEMAEASRHRLLRLPCRADEWARAGGVPLPHHRPMAALAEATQPEGPPDLGADHEAVG